MKIQKKLKWTAPYLEVVKDLVPLSKIKEIRGFSVGLDKQELVHATITRNGRKFNINLKLTNNDTFEYRQRAAFMNDLLHHLSHELAHLKYWCHDGNHMILEAKIMLRFGKLTKQLGIKNTYKRMK